MLTPERLRLETTTAQSEINLCSKVERIDGRLLTTGLIVVRDWIAFTMGSLWAKSVKLQRQQNQNSKVKILERTKFIGRIMSHRINV